MLHRSCAQRSVRPEAMERARNRECSNCGGFVPSGSSCKTLIQLLPSGS